MFLTIAAQDINLSVGFFFIIYDISYIDETMSKMKSNRTERCSVLRFVYTACVMVMCDKVRNV